MLYRTKPRKTASPETLANLPAGTGYTLRRNKDNTVTPIFDLAVAAFKMHIAGIKMGEPDKDFADSLRMDRIKHENERRGIRVTGFRNFDGSLA